MSHRKRNKRHIRLGHTGNPVGYCRKYRSVISPNQIKAKQCRERHCPNLKPYSSPMDRAAKHAEHWEEEHQITKREVK